MTRPYLHYRHANFAANRPDGKGNSACRKSFFMQMERNSAINIASATLPDICVEPNARKTLPDWKSDGNLTG
jgi:hypothetical protein